MGHTFEEKILELETSIKAGKSLEPLSVLISGSGTKRTELRGHRRAYAEVGQSIREDVRVKGSLQQLKRTLRAG